MLLTDGLRWVSRVALGAAVGALMVIPVPDVASGSMADTVVVGYPRCTAEETPNGWMWFAGPVKLGMSKSPTIVHAGAEYQTDRVDCSGARTCLRSVPELDGKLATIVGTSDSDRLVGTSGRDLIIGGGGNDVLRGEGAADVLCGGPGDDTLRGGNGDDRLDGGDGADRLFGRGGNDHLVGGPGDDALYGNMGADVLAGGDGADSCIGGGAEDSMVACRVEVEGGAIFGGDRVLTYTVEVEEGIGVSRTAVVTEVDRILADDRSWIADGSTGFRRRAAGGDFTILVASPNTVDRLCAPLGTGGYLSCRNGSRIILNVNRWLGATDWWEAGLATYREYLVNHEVGHLLGYGHVGCPSAGAPAPVMMQQTKGLGSCVANGWPYAEVAAG